MGLMFDTPKFELDADHGPLITRVAIAMIILSFFGVSLRFLSRRLVQQRYLWDDWIIVLALPLSWTICILEIVAAKHGSLGRHIELATEATVKQFFKDLYVVQLIYGFSIALTKISIILFYGRVFGSKQTKIPLMIINGIVGAWLIATSLVAIFSCTPVDSFWDRTMSNSQCVNTSTYFMASGALNIATDIAILIIPIPMVWRLKIFLTQKITILGVFLLGGFIIIVSLLRLVAIAQANGNPDFTWAWLPLAVWTTIETNVAIFCACIPCMRPLLRMIQGKNIYAHDNSTIETEDSNHNPNIENRSKRSSHKTWWSGIRVEAYRNNGDGNSNFLWLTDTNEEKMAGGSSKTVISANRMSMKDIEIPELPELSGLDVPRIKKGIIVEKKVMWT